MWVRETLETMPQQALRRMQHSGERRGRAPERGVRGGLYNPVHALVVGAQLGVDAAVEEDLGDTRVAALARLKEGRLSGKW